MSRTAGQSVAAGSLLLLALYGTAGHLWPLGRLGPDI